jgi:asparagine synthase (glutamine-hydrolysing)
MCGIAGKIIANSSISQNLDEPLVREMVQLMAHRGPDSAGYWQNNWVKFGHSRLAIVDKSSLSDQPMIDNLGNALTFNGEIYNFRDLRNQLIDQYKTEFKTLGDAEVLLRGLSLEGIDFVNKIDGDFAFAFYSSSEGVVYLTRDRFGIKPLYWHNDNQCIVFASEVKPILLAGVSAEVNPVALRQYLQFRYVRSRDQTLFKSINRVEPGQWVRISKTGEVFKNQYWQLQDLSTKGINNYSQDGFENLLAKSISRRAHDDTSVLLSGGIDSSAIAITAVKNGSTNSFTLNTGTNAQDLFAAKEVANQLKINNHVIAGDSLDADSITQSIYSLEEPIGDSIIGPTLQLFKEVAMQGKVSLSGEGADELFGSYAHHNILKILDRFFLNGSNAFSSLMDIIPLKILDFINPYPSKVSDAFVLRAKECIKTNSLKKRHTLLSSLLTEAEVDRVIALQTESIVEPEFTSWIDCVKYDVLHWLPNYNLLRVDKLSMQSSHEVRLPYLDHNFFQYVFSQLQSDKQNLLSNKKPIRKFLKKSGHIDKAFAKRKKFPLYYSVTSYRDKAFIAWAKNKLSEENISRYGLLNPKEVTLILNDAESFLNFKKISCLLHLQIWCELFLDGGWRKFSETQGALKIR